MKTLITSREFDEMWDLLSMDWEVDRATIQQEPFKDGTDNLVIDDPESIVWKDVTFIWDYSNMNKLMRSYFITRGLLHYRAKSLQIISPYFPVWTHERVKTWWQIPTAKYTADVMSLLPPGRATYNIWDIHNKTEQFLFDDLKVAVDLHTAMSLIRDEVWTIALPDKWADNNFSWLFPWHDKVVFDKIRTWDKRELTYKEWEVTDEVTLIDDLAQTWWTLIEAANLLREMWAKRVNAYVTHWVFPWDSHKKIADNVDTLYTTNSIPENKSRAEEVSNMVCLDISGLVRNIIKQ